MILLNTVAMRTSIPASSQPRRSGVAACSETVDAMTDLAGCRPAEVAPGLGATRTYVLDIAIPGYNEEQDLPGSVRRLPHFLATEGPYPSPITVAGNPSTDSTLAGAQALADDLH